MKRRLVFWVLLLFLAAGGIWYLVFRQSGMYRVREGIPEDAVFIVETPSFNRYVTNYTGIGFGHL